MSNPGGIYSHTLHTMLLKGVIIQGKHSDIFDEPEFLQLKDIDRRDVTLVKTYGVSFGVKSSLPEETIVISRSEFDSWLHDYFVEMHVQKQEASLQEDRKNKRLDEIWNDE